MAQFDVNWGAVPGHTSPRWWCPWPFQYAICNIWPPRSPSISFICAGPRIMQLIGLIQSLDSMWLDSGSTTLIPRRAWGCHKRLYISETFENNRALWPAPQRDCCGSHSVELENNGAPFSTYYLKTVRYSWYWHGNLWVCWRDRNIYKSGKQVCTGLQVY